MFIFFPVPPLRKLSSDQVPPTGRSNSIPVPVIIPPSPDPERRNTLPNTLPPEEIW